MDYKAYALMAILLASVASVALVGVANAQTKLTLKTDKPSYTTGDEITVTGNLNATSINQPLLIQVFDPDHNFIRSDTTTAAADGSYSYTFKTGGPLMAKTGTYTIAVTYKGTTKQETTFDFTSTGVPTSGGWKDFIITVENVQYKVRYMITNGTVQDMVPSSDTQSLTITIKSTGDGKLQLRLPRNVIDARQGTDGKSGPDDDFAAFADEESVPVDESNATDPTIRQVSIDFANGTETIEIVGTWAIPEFGAIAAIILAVAIVGIIVATARYGKLNFAPRL
jgi:predicted secreted protein with PEFG-CTERM motif